MKPKRESKRVLNLTRAKAKMIEYHVPDELQNVNFNINPSKLFSLTIGILGDYVHKINQPNITNRDLVEMESSLRFSSRFFDSYLQSGLDNTIDIYLTLIASATYYLCDLLGHSIVMINKIKERQLNLDVQGLENLLFWLLKPDNLIENIEKDNEYIRIIVESFYMFTQNGEDENELLNILNAFRENFYNNSSARCLLFADIISAIIKKKITKSCWKALPIYSELDVSYWTSTINKTGFIKELWPSQHLIGEKGVFSGKSAILQMPTSAGKTKSNEIIIRSAFLGERTSMAVIIAPFRALCHEIYNDLYKAFWNEKHINVFEVHDVLQMDIPTDQLSGNKQILIITPEKFFYILSHNKDIAILSNLFIFDEGHQFDNGSRGITYELLLTTLLLLVSPNSQKVLISAVISNANEVSNWLIGYENIVSGINIISTFRTIGFVSCMYKFGQIHYVKEENNEADDFFVPRVIEHTNLNLLGRERAPRVFPDKSDGKAISLYLGLKLVQNGSVAIFCGKKSSVSEICKKLMDIVRRGYFIDIPNLIPNLEEVKNLAGLYCLNLGEESIATISSKLGIFAHHNNIPHGIRIAVEYAMRENLIKFVICTSTLAQGVNLPIRYLIISSFNQSDEVIKTRDFNNLIGRAGRAGMHTEGSILFADPKIYDNKGWHWRIVQGLLKPEKNEPCSSRLHLLFEPFISRNGAIKLSLTIIEFLKMYIEEPNVLKELIRSKLQENDDYYEKNSFENNITNKISIISAIEGFLLSNWDEIENIEENVGFSNIITKTFGYSIADEEMRTQLIDLVNMIENHIRTKIVDKEQRKRYGKTLYGINDAISIESWVKNNIDLLKFAANEENLLKQMWDIMKEKFINKLKLTNIDNLKLVMIAWISGIRYNKLLEMFQTNEIKYIWGKGTRDVGYDDIVNICDNTFSYNGCLLLNAIYEFALEIIDANENLIHLLQNLQKRLKYGLPDETTAIIYELGFSDRVISQDIKNTLDISGNDRLVIINDIRRKGDLAMQLIMMYPAYYQKRMIDLIN